MPEAKYMIRLSLDDKDIDKSVRTLEKKMSKTMPNMEISTRKFDESIKELGKEIKDSTKGLGVDTITLGSGLGTSIGNAITKDLGSGMGKIMTMTSKKDEDIDISKLNKQLYESFLDLEKHAKRIDEPFDDYDYREPANAFWAETQDKDKVMDSVTEDENILSDIDKNAKLQTTKQDSSLGKLTEIGKSVLPIVGIGAAIATISKTLVDSSAYLKGSLDILGQSFILLFKPLGDALGSVLLPMAIEMLKFALKWQKVNSGIDIFNKARKGDLKLDELDNINTGFDLLDNLIGNASAALILVNEGLEYLEKMLGKNMLGVNAFADSLDNMENMLNPEPISNYEQALNGLRNAFINAEENIQKFIQDIKSEFKNITGIDIDAAVDSVVTSLQSGTDNFKNWVGAVGSYLTTMNLASLWNIMNPINEWVESVKLAIEGKDVNGEWLIMDKVNMWVNKTGLAMNALDLPSVWNLGDIVASWFEGEKKKSGIDGRKSEQFTDDKEEKEIVIPPIPIVPNLEDDLQSTPLIEPPVDTKEVEDILSKQLQSTPLIEPPVDEKTVKDILDNAQSMYNIHGGGKVTLPNTRIEGGSQPQDLNDDNMIDVFTEPTNSLKKLDFELQRLWKHLNTLPFGHNPEAYTAALDQNPILGQFITSKMTIGSSIERLETMLEGLSTTKSGREDIADIFANNPLLQHFAGDQLPADIRKTSTNTEDMANTLRDIKNLLANTQTQTPTLTPFIIPERPKEGYLRGVYQF